MTPWWNEWSVTAVDDWIEISAKNSVVHIRVPSVSAATLVQGLIAILLQREEGARSKALHERAMEELRKADEALGLFSNKPEREELPPTAYGVHPSCLKEFLPVPQTAASSDDTIRLGE